MRCVTTATELPQHANPKQKDLQVKYSGLIATGKCFEHFESPVCRARKIQAGYHSG